MIDLFSRYKQLGEHAELGVCIAKYIYDNKDVTEVDINWKAHYLCDKVKTLLTLQKLCLMKNPLLKLKYEYRDSNGEVYPISAQEAKNGLHPITKKVIPESIFKEKVFMIFKVIAR